MDRGPPVPFTYKRQERRFTNVSLSLEDLAHHALGPVPSSAGRFGNRSAGAAGAGQRSPGPPRSLPTKNTTSCDPSTQETP